MSSVQHYTWVVNTNSNTCYIYKYSRESDELSLYKTIEHPENKLRDSDITSDRPGHYKANGSSRGAFSQQTDPKEIKIDDFSREIAKELDHGRNTHLYNDIILIAPPHMNGSIVQHINKHVKELVSHFIEKDVVYLNGPELITFLHTHAHSSRKS